MDKVVRKYFTRQLGIFLMMISLFCGCAFSHADTTEKLPAEFQQLNDTAKVAYMMKRLAPDSMARFVCNSALNKIPLSPIDSFAATVRYLYTAYNDSDLVVFCEELNTYPATLSPSEKIKIYLMASENKPARLGYRMGKDYAAELKKGKISLEIMKEEIEIIKDSLRQDSNDFNKFFAGLKTGLNSEEADESIIIFIDKLNKE